jgi:hypothetical protein
MHANMSYKLDSNFKLFFHEHTKFTALYLFQNVKIWWKITLFYWIIIKLITPSPSVVGTTFKKRKVTPGPNFKLTTNKLISSN